MLLKILCTVVSACLLTACASSLTRSPPVVLPANLAQPCQHLPLPDDRTGAGILRWAQTVIRLYNDCADRHDATVQAWPVE